jgi:glutamine phosphoribosylpyrophosphate amidotransferase
VGESLYESTIDRKRGGVLMGRLFAEIARIGTDVSLDTIFAMGTMGYAGPRGFGIVSLTEEGLRTFTSNLVATQAFAKMLKEEIAALSGNVCIGYNSTNGKAMPIEIRNSRRLDLSVAIDGNQETSDEVISWMKRGRSLYHSVSLAMKKVKGHFALVAMSCDGKLIAARSSGLMPLSIGMVSTKNGVSAMYASSQSSVLDGGATFVRSVLPGEIICLRCDGYTSEYVPCPDNNGCPIEAMFLLGPNNKFGGRWVQAIRASVGKALGKKVASSHPDVNSDDWVLLAIPDGGNMIAEGASLELKAEFLRSIIVKNRYPVNSEIGHLVVDGVIVESKYTLAGAVPLTAPDYDPAFDAGTDGSVPPLKGMVGTLNGLIKGKKVLILDDSLFTGDLLRRFAKMLREAGAIEVHAATPTVTEHHCPDGKDAHRIGVVPKSYAGRIDQIAVDLGLDSLTTLTIDELINAIGTSQKILCTECLCS